MKYIEHSEEKDALIRNLLDEYAREFGQYRSGESYKWRAIKTFQEKWNADADGFAAMLEEALAGSFNLLNGGNYYPKKMLLEYAREFPDRVRYALVDILFDESRDIVSRMKECSAEIEDIHVAVNARKKERGEEEAGHTYNDPRAMNVYLTFFNPSMHFFYKNSMLQACAKRLDVDLPSNKYEKVVAYEELCNAILDILVNEYPELIAESDALLGAELAAVDPAHHILVQDIAFYVQAYASKGSSTVEPTETDKPSVWVYSPGEGACAWEACLDQGIMVLGWDELGDFAQYDSRDEIASALQETRGEGSCSNASLACWDFQSNMKLGDVVYAKRGTSAILGKGVVKSTPRFDDLRSGYKHVRDVEWLVKGEWSMTGLPMKTLTNWDAYPDAIAQVEALISAESSAEVSVAEEFAAYGDKDFLSEVYVSADKLAEMKSLLRRKKNIILQGAPGTGKTFAAKRLAYCMMGQKAESRVRMVQFHQSSTYDDFVIGYRPDGKGGFEVAEGVFTRFCDRAVTDPSNDYFLVIDEINRANISKVLGELLMLIEADHRGESVFLPVGGRSLAVPENLYIIGMMNTADRGLALIDYALRRRFAFVEMEPALTHPAFLETVGQGALAKLAGAVAELNEEIAKDAALGDGFRIGHSYFCGASDEDAESILRYEIAPLIREYWFDDVAKATDKIKKLEAALS